ncbi:MAG: FAD:protein FMN transferase [Burkholderiaceae bacterium]|nr:FAD:protein FMN transferase [Burkholderiaceae bacterium]
MRRAQPWLGTLVDIAADGALPDAALADAITRAFHAVALVQRLMSFHDPDSDVSRLNRARPGDALAVHPHTFHVLQLAQAVAHASSGTFNIACAPRLVAWDCLPAPTDTVPAYEPGLEVLRCEAGGAVRKMAPGWIDLSGIAKGYAVDLAIGALMNAGATSACVNAGGDLRVFGADAVPVAIRDPRNPYNLRQGGATVPLQNEAMATSAGYFSMKEWDGGRVCALIDGRSGLPLQGKASVSVRAPRCALADALTKVIAASGDARHPALAEFGATALII